MLTGKYNYTSLAAAELHDPLIVERGCDYTAEHYPFPICTLHGFKTMTY